MPKLELTKNELLVRLSWWEALASLQKTFSIPLKDVRGATDDEGFRGWSLGLRSPGTGIPGIVSAGTYRKDGDCQFVFVTRGTHPVVIELNHKKWTRMILGVKDAKCVVRTINAALAKAI